MSDHHDPERDTIMLDGEERLVTRRCPLGCGCPDLLDREPAAIWDNTTAGLPAARVYPEAPPDDCVCSCHDSWRFVNGPIQASA